MRKLVNQTPLEGPTEPAPDCVSGSEKNGTKGNSSVWSQTPPRRNATQAKGRLLHSCSSQQQETRGFPTIAGNVCPSITGMHVEGKVRKFQPGLTRSELLMKQVGPSSNHQDLLRQKGPKPWLEDRLADQSNLSAGDAAQNWKCNTEKTNHTLH